MENKELKERDFHHGSGHSIPFVIKLVWTALITWGIIYLVRFGLPDLKIWLNK